MTRTSSTYPVVHQVLSILSEAGPDGIQSIDVAEHFQVEGETRQSLLSWTNIVLSRLKRDGRARRSPTRQFPPGSNDGRRRAYRWWITPAGEKYLHPLPLPTIVPVDGPPTSKGVLEVLKEAGEEGMRGPDIARHFNVDYPGMPSVAHLSHESQCHQRRMTWTNQILERFKTNGWARKGGLEPSPYYNNVPAYRWFITPEGRGYLAAGMAAGIREAQRFQHEREAVKLAAHRKRLADLLTEAYASTDPATTPKCERTRIMKHLREAGCTLQDIGDVFGVTRERARQLIEDISPSVCTCPRCVGEKG